MAMEERSDIQRERALNDELEDANVRTLKFDLSNCPEWVRLQNDEELFQIFKIGVAVKESITMNITGGKKYFDKIENQVQNTQTKLEDKIKDGLRSTQMALEGKMNELLWPLNACKDQLKELACKPASKGAVGELVILSVLQEGLPQHTTRDVSRVNGKYGDIHVTSTVTGQTHLLEVKTHSYAVPATEIEKFENDLRQSKHCTVGILLSLDSGIAMRAKHGKFEIQYEDKQYFIYVPNARKEQNMIVWSVLLADELAALEEGLTETQTQELLKLQKKFQENMEKTKACRAKFESLKELVNDLEGNLMPLLQVIDGAKSELNKALHQRGKMKSQKKTVISPQQPKIDEYIESVDLLF